MIPIDFCRLEYLRPLLKYRPASVLIHYFVQKMRFIDLTVHSDTRGHVQHLERRGQEIALADAHLDRVTRKPWHMLRRFFPSRIRHQPRHLGIQINLRFIAQSQVPS